MTVRHHLGLAFLVLASGGCSRPLYNGPNFLNSRNANADRARFERFDPLPDENLGPDTFSRPPGFETQRTQARQAAESRALPLRPAPESGTPILPSSQYTYPGVVRE